MNEKPDKKMLLQRLHKMREKLLQEFPFYGKLLMNLKIALADCQTASTDMRTIFFCPEFIDPLSDTELKFLFLHELFHSVLKHPLRCRDEKLDRHIYNIAADLVVNSMILELWSMDDFTLSGVEVRHLVDGEEACFYTAEQIYDMLIEEDEEELYKDFIPTDCHQLWKQAEKDVSALADKWSKLLAQLKSYNNSSAYVNEIILREIHHKEHISEIDWYELLKDYLNNSQYDYTFSVPDKRLPENVIMPSYQKDLYNLTVEKVWMFADVSGSIDNETLSKIMFEVGEALDWFNNISVYLSFFNTNVYEPQIVESSEDLENLTPPDYGGTDFHCIFDYIRKSETEKPSVIVILTDGEAEMPDPEEAMDIPVLWIIIGNEDITPSWGETVHITND